VRRVTVARSAAAVIFANRSNARMNDRLAKRKPFERAPLLLRAVYRYSGQHSNGKLPNSGIIAEAARISPNLERRGLWDRRFSVVVDHLEPNLSKVLVYYFY
jgi:hypothetical protein